MPLHYLLGPAAPARAREWQHHRDHAAAERVPRDILRLDQVNAQAGPNIQVLLRRSPSAPNEP
jgi:hypothetical protein